MNEILVNGKKTKIYIQPKDLIAEFNKSVELGQPTNQLLVMFGKIAKNFCTQFEYKNKCDMDACINFAVSEAWLKWNKYNSERSDNVFSFYTTMIANDLRLHYKQLTRGKSTHVSLDALFSNNQE